MTKAQRKKPDAYFGAIPFRALADRHLGDLDIRVLGIVAAHDNMSLIRGGDGCFAGTDRISDLAHANASNVSSALTKLVASGYLERGPHPRDRRRATLRVIYDAKADKAAFKGAGILPRGKLSHATAQDVSRPAAELPTNVSCPPSSINGRKQPIQATNKPVEETHNKPSGESAPPSVGAWLARTERALNSSDDLDLTNIREHLEAIIDSTEFGDADHHRAERLLDMLIDRA